MAFDKRLLDQAGFQDSPNLRFLFYDLGAQLDMTSMKIFHDIQEAQYHRGTKEKSEFEVTSFNFDEPPSDVDLEVRFLSNSYFFTFKSFFCINKKRTNQISNGQKKENQQILIVFDVLGCGFSIIDEFT